MQDVVKRSNSQNSKRKYKRNMSLYFMVIFIIAFSAFAILSVTVFFNIEEIDVAGSSCYTAEEIIKASGLSAGDNMIRKNLVKSADMIKSKLVYIEEAKIKRVFPNSVRIEVAPCEETAVIESEKGFYLISKGGKILNITDNPRSDLILFKGTEPAENLSVGDKFISSNEDKTEILYKLIDAGSAEYASSISEYDITDRLNISCLYDNRITVELGIITEIDYKLKFANEIITQKIGSKTEGTLTILSDGASFLDKESLEKNKQVFNQNMQTSDFAETTLSDSQNSENSNLSTDTELSESTAEDTNTDVFE